MAIFAGVRGGATGFDTAHVGMGVGFGVKIKSPGSLLLHLELLHRPIVLRLEINILIGLHLELSVRSAHFVLFACILFK